MESLSPQEAAARIQERLFPDPKKAAPAQAKAAEATPEPEQPEPAEEEEELEAGAEENAQLEGDDDPEAQPIQSLADLAERLEVDEEELAKLLKVKGRDGAEVPLADVLEAYRKPAPEAAELEGARAKLAEYEQVRSAYQEATQQLAAAAAGFAQRLKASEPDWALLEKTNPQQYALERLKYMDGVRQLELADQRLQAARAREQHEQQVKLQEFRAAEARKLQSQVPEWKDAKVFEADLSKTERYLVDTWKLKPEEVAQIADHRDWTIADKARRWDELQAKKPEVLEKVKQLPRVMTPGTITSPDRGAAARAAKAEAELTDKLRTSGSVHDAAAILAQRMERSNRRAAARTLARRRV